ncbi:hypothetical protein GJAV_G00114280 [Gymnothorax javanicus]|nr:hypothetical protein GJAV_G00114280 [Gymnothorax javanicus]
MVYRVEEVDTTAASPPRVQHVLLFLMQVILGGGRKYMLPNKTVDPEYPKFTGTRLDNVNLINKWLQAKKNARFVWNKADFDSVDVDETDYLMGLFEPSDMRFELDRDATTDPSLTEMMEKAIRILRRNPNGFYLFVEKFLAAFV